MSLIIKGMKMPKNGETTIAFASDENGENTLTLLLDTNGKPIEHKGVAEIPTPHGRLIDADSLIKTIESIYGGALWTFDCFECIRQAPTIIEAEVSE